MELKAGYKQTEVGVIPEDWDVMTLSQTARGIFRGASPRPIENPIWFEDASDVGWVRIADVTKSGRHLTETTQRLSKQGILHSRFVPCGSLIMSICATVGRPIETRLDVCIHDGFVVFDRPLTDQGYLYHVLKDLEPRWASKGQTGSQMNLNGNLIKSTIVPAPSTKAEQEAIAEALSDADALIESLDQLITKKRYLKQAAMQQLLTGQTRLPGFSGEWEPTVMRDVLSQPATYGIVKAGAFVHDGVKMLRGGDIVDGRINSDLPMVAPEKAMEYGRTTLVANDVVIALVGYPGASAKIPDALIGSNISRAVGLLRLNGKVTPDYLVCMLNSDTGRRMVLAPSAGSAQQVVNLAALNKLEFNIPKPSEQTAIATILSDMDAELAELDARLAKARHIKQGMMQELLTGRIRLL